MKDLPLHNRLISIRSVFIIPLLFLCTLASAQSLSVEKFQLLDNDLTANTRGTMKYDQNGDVAALIKIVTTESDFNFDVGSLGVVATSQQKGEIWVYVPGGVQRITISHSQLGVLRNYYFPIPIEKARTYELILASGRVRTIIEDDFNSQYVVFKVTPQNAIVSIDGNPYGLQADGTVSQLLSFGTHSYRVDAPGFISENGIVEVGRERIIREVALKSSKGTVTLECSMKEAEIYLNDNLVGTGSWTGQLDAAMYRVEIKREGHTSRTTSFTLQPQEERIISLPVPQPIYGTVSITSQPIGATVYIDGEEIGTTPLLKGQILTGKRKVEFRMQDYRPVTMEVEIKEGQLNSFSTEMSDSFLATIRTEPGGASIILDGSEIGQTPYKYETSSGDYEISLSKKGYAPFKKKVHLDASNPELMIKLQRKILLKNNFYFGVNYQMGHVSGSDGYVGLYLAGINLEYSYQNTGEGVREVWWIEDPSSWEDESGLKYEYLLACTQAAYAGYGIRCGNQWRFTPRVGVLINYINGASRNSNIPIDLNQETYVISGRLGIRTEYSPLRHVGIVCTPSYDIPVVKGSFASQLDQKTTIVKDWCSGFAINLGVELYF